MSVKVISEKRPWVSNSLGVHPDDVPASNEHAKKMGFVHRYEENGQPIATSDRGRNDAMKMQNAHAREGGYGDWCGN